MKCNYYRKLFQCYYYHSFYNFSVPIVKIQLSSQYSV